VLDLPNIQPLKFKAVSFMQFLPKNAIAMTICTFLQFCVISIILQFFITVPVSHMKQQLECSAYCVVLFDSVYKFCYKGNISLRKWIFCLNRQLSLQRHTKSETLLHKDIQPIGEDRRKILLYINSVILVFIKPRLH